MADIGMSAALKGYDVKTCPDRNLAWSSSFQTLKIYSTYTATTTIPASGVNTITITHSLGYLCPYIVIYNGSTGIGTNKSYFFSDSVFPLVTRGYTDRVEIDVDSFFDSGFSSTGNTVYFTVYVFLDDFRTVNALNINVGTASPGASTNDYGLSASKPGFDVKTCTSDQLAFSSSFYNQIVHMKGITSTLPLSHSLGYIPAHLSFIKFSGNAYIENYQFFGTNSTELDITGTLGVGDTAYYIIFKNQI